MAHYLIETNLYFKRMNTFFLRVLHCEVGNLRNTTHMN